MSTQSSREKARHFIENETPFHLGALPTEQAHPGTADLSMRIQSDVAAGVAQLLTVDEDIPPVASRVMQSEAFESLVGAFLQAMREERRVFFTGCGSTGRLSILLDAAWRECWQRLGPKLDKAGGTVPDLEDLTTSVMAGGDYALIRAVEGFEDFTRFGRHQLREAGVGAGDVVVEITEGGETSFVIGTAWEGVDAGARVFFVFNNPAGVLAEHVERSREVIEDGRITLLDLATGPMGIAGSTRLQATTAEFLVVATALETALRRFLEDHLPGAQLDAAGIPAPEPASRAQRFRALLDELRSPENLETLGEYVTFEADIYRDGGRVTYAADHYLLDIFTDTTERSPTFSLPPFRKFDDEVSAVSWAYVKHPLDSTPDTWKRVLHREPRCLEWDASVYRELDAPEAILQNPPKLDREELYRFRICREEDPTRYATEANALVLLTVGNEIEQMEQEGRASPYLGGFRAMAGSFAGTAALGIGAPPPAGVSERAFHIACELPPTPLALWEHMAAKLVLNTLSTATMALIGRVIGNWMACVEAGNKKLIDRATRLISELTGVDYRTACERLFEAIEVVTELRRSGKKVMSPVEWAVEKYGLAPYYAERRAQSRKGA